MNEKQKQDILLDIEVNIDEGKPMYYNEGRVNISLEDFWEFVMQYLPEYEEIRFGVPKIVDGELSISYAASSEPLEIIEQFQNSEAYKEQTNHKK